MAIAKFAADICLAVLCAQIELDVLLVILKTFSHYLIIHVFALLAQLMLMDIAKIAQK